MNNHDTQTFNISRRDAKAIVEALEHDAKFDKTEIYYLLKKWVDPLFVHTLNVEVKIRKDEILQGKRCSITGSPLALALKKHGFVQIEESMFYVLVRGRNGQHWASYYDADLLDWMSSWHSGQDEHLLYPVDFNMEFRKVALVFDSGGGEIQEFPRPWPTAEDDYGSQN